LDRDFVVVHARANNCCHAEPFFSDSTLVPKVMEFTLIRRDRVQSSESNLFRSPQIPHPSDITRNVPRRRPLHLGGSWLVGPRPLGSSLKIGFDFALWFLYVHRHGPYKVKRAMLRGFQNAGVVVTSRIRRIRGRAK
jgi:hypothetical protein